MIPFEQGLQDYLNGVPRPPTPTDYNCYEPEAMRWYGWMVGRMQDIDKIIRELELAGIRHSDSYDTIFRRRDSIRSIRRHEAHH
jgi:hypothetical protein